MSSSCALSRPQSCVECPSRASKMASAVPQEPAPMTVIGSVRRVCILLIHQVRLLRGLLRLAEQSVEIHQRQEEIGEAAFDDQIGNHFARIGKQHAGTETTDQAL